MSDLSTDARLLADVVTDIVNGVEALDTVDVTQGILIREVIAASQAALLGARQDLESKLGAAMGPDFCDVAGKRYHRENRWGTSNAQNADLVRAVLDSRVFDADGTLIEETPIDKLKAVYPLPVRDARKTALKARGIDPSEFIQREWRGYSVVEDR